MRYSPRETLKLAFLVTSRGKGTQGHLVWTLRKLYLYCGNNIRLQTTLQSRRPTVNEPRELRLGRSSLPPSPYHSLQAFS